MQSRARRVKTRKVARARFLARLVDKGPEVPSRGAPKRAAGIGLTEVRHKRRCHRRYFEGLARRRPSQARQRGWMDACVQRVVAPTLVHRSGQLAHPLRLRSQQVLVGRPVARLARPRELMRQRAARSA